MSSEADICAQIEERRLAGVPFDGSELARRIEDLGDIRLDSRVRHDAFRELYEAFTPVGFRFLPFPDGCKASIAGHRIALKAVIVDDANGQVVGEINRDLSLDQEIVNHELLRIQDAYRGSGLSHLVLNQAFPLYRQLGLKRVLIHAALETGRWHWARLGFDFLDEDERRFVMGWALAALAGLGAATIVDPHAPARRLAQLGSAPPEEQATMQTVCAAVKRQVKRWQADATMAAGVNALVSEWDRRTLLESGGRLSTFDPARIDYLAARNGIGAAEPIPIGKAIMLTGPDWLGAFDLHDPGSADAFEREVSRRFAQPQ